MGVARKTPIAVALSVHYGRNYAIRCGYGVIGDGCRRWANPLRSLIWLDNLNWLYRWVGRLLALPLIDVIWRRIRALLCGRFSLRCGACFRCQWAWKLRLTVA